jgi:three-Cys-motif partner protein
MIELDIPDHYKGREPAFIKHYFLRQYVEKLAFKIGSRFDDLVYVDGFSGPWKSGAENYDDTSFGIALQCLTKARTAWRGIKPHYRDVRMTAHLVEKNKDAFRELEGINPRFPEVSIFPHNGDFLELAPAIAARIPPRAFTFALIDPKGFSLDLEALRPLLTRPRTEVVFNFMYDFANRWIDLPELSDTYDRLLPGIDWRNRLAEAADAGPAARKAAFLACFKDAVRDVFGFRYVADVDIRHGSKDRTLYFLVYGTREPAGIEVFRDCQVRALEAQAQAAGQRNIERRAEGGTGSLFGPEWEAFSVNHRCFLEDQKQAAAENLLAVAAAQPGILWEQTWPKLLADHVVRKTDLGRIAGRLHKERHLILSGLEKGRQVPQPKCQLSIV